MSVSVIVPVYNTGTYLPDCLDSIIDQTYHDLEIIVVDDGSTDTSAEIIKRYADADPRIVALRQENAGVSAARNLGVSVATGSHIIFVDSDDTIHPEMVAYLLAILTENHAEAAAARLCHDATEMSTSGKCTLYTSTEAIIDTLYQHDLDPSLCGKIFPAEAVKKTRQDPGRRYEDLAVFYKIYENITGPIVATTAALYHYRDNASSFIHNFTPERLDVLDVTRQIEEHYSYNKEILKAARDRRFSANFNMMVLAHRAGLHQQAAKCWEVIKAYRWQEITNPRVRAKNKIGALISYLGKAAVIQVAALIRYR